MKKLKLKLTPKEMNNMYLIKPQKVLDFNPKLVKYPCVTQPKLNGLSAYYNQGYFYTRTGEIWNRNMVSHITKHLDGHIDPKHILCGEFYTHGLTLQQINSYIGINRKERLPETDEILFYVFDLVCVDFYKEDFCARFSHVHDYGEHALYVNYRWCYDEKFLEWQRVGDLELGYEGTIIRNPSAPYRTDERNSDVMRLKPTKHMRCACRGVEVGAKDKQYSNVVGKLICQMDDGTLFKVSSGLTDIQRTLFMKPTYQEDLDHAVIDIDYETLSADGIPLKPRIKCITYPHSQNA